MASGYSIVQGPLPVAGYKARYEAGFENLRKMFGR
jgi:hypothetical protein